MSRSRGTYQRYEHSPYSLKRSLTISCFSPENGCLTSALSVRSCPVHCLADSSSETRPCCWQEVNFQAVDGEVDATGLVDIRKDLPRAVASIFKGPAAQRRAVVDRLYAKARYSIIVHNYLLTR